MAPEGKADLEALFQGRRTIGLQSGRVGVGEGAGGQPRQPADAGPPQPQRRSELIGCALERSCGHRRSRLPDQSLELVQVEAPGCDPQHMAGRLGRDQVLMADGTWQRLLTHAPAKFDAVGEIDWEVVVDATIMRAHRHAAGTRRRGQAVRRVRC